MSNSKNFTKEAQEFIGLDTDNKVDAILDEIYKQDVNFREIQEKISQIKCRPFVDYVNRYLYLKYFQDDMEYEEISNYEFKKCAKQVAESRGMKKEWDSLRKQWNSPHYKVERMTIFKMAFA